MGCGCRGGGSTGQAAAPQVLGWNYQPPRVDGVLPPQEGPFQTILEARARQRFYGGGSIKAIRKTPTT